MTNKALTYAEEDLGVHAIYEKAIKDRNELDEILTALADRRDIKRDLEAKIADAEMDVIIEERGKHPDMAVSRWEKHIKEAFQQDPTIRSLKEHLGKVVNDLDGFDFDRVMVETDIKIGIARMNELGGYLQYLAEVKRAAALTPVQPTQTESGESA